MSKTIVNGCLVLAAISLVVGIVSRLLLKPLFFGLEGQAFVQFSQTLLLFAIAFGIKEFTGKRKE
jgi:sensor domain CHASE-containing protein